LEEAVRPGAHEEAHVITAADMVEARVVHVGEVRRRHVRFAADQPN
jgi:hypothetical protein